MACSSVLCGWGGWRGGVAYSSVWVWVGVGGEGVWHVAVCGGVGGGGCGI